MQVTISSRPAKADVCCRFYEHGKGLHAPDGGRDRRAKRNQAEWFESEDGQLSFAQNVSMLKWYERAEAWRVAGGLSVRRAASNGAKNLCWVVDGVLREEEFKHLLHGA